MTGTPQQDRNLGLPRTRSGGRFVTAYVPDLALQICERIADGETLKGICEDEGMPARSTFNRWVVQHAELSRAYAAARELSSYAMEEEALDIARTLSAEGRDFTSTKVAAYDKSLGQLRWSASRRNPKTFSERGAVQITVPIQINTSLDLGDGGMLSADHPDIYKLDAVVDTAQLTDAEHMQVDAPPLTEANPSGVRRQGIKERNALRVAGEIPKEQKGW